jgi:hypothetical protein
LRAGFAQDCNLQFFYSMRTNSSQVSDAGLAPQPTLSLFAPVKNPGPGKEEQEPTEETEGPEGKSLFSPFPPVKNPGPTSALPSRNL